MRSTIRSAVKTARGAVSEKTPQAKESVLEAIRILDRAVSRGIIHRNTAARKKSTLARSLAREVTHQPRGLVPASR